MSTYVSLQAVSLDSLSQATRQVIKHGIPDEMFKSWKALDIIEATENEATRESFDCDVGGDDEPIGQAVSSYLYDPKYREITDEVIEGVENAIVNAMGNFESEWTSGVLEEITEFLRLHKGKTVFVSNR